MIERELDRMSLRIYVSECQVVIVEVKDGEYRINEYKMSE